MKLWELKLTIKKDHTCITVFNPMPNKLHFSTLFNRYWYSINKGI